MTKQKEQPLLGINCPIDVDKLVESRLLVQSNSGGGKSWAIRRLIEQTYGYAQQIIIDHDGEYHTLREKFDFVLAGPKGECAADIRSAALLARRLLELNVSAIIDIYELGTQRAEFVKRFLEALVNAPRELWHSAIIVLDEAHIYCPEKGSAVSSDAVKNLMALGRKRGFSGCLATQRIAKLDKDAAAECNSKLIGRSSLDVDMQRSARELGFSSKEKTESLRTLKAGEFYAFGPAFSDQVQLVKVGPVQTTHLRAGQRAAPPTPPRDRIKKILAELADLPQEAAEEAKTVNELKLRVKQLEDDARKAKAVMPTQPEIVERIVEKPILKDVQIKRLEALFKKTEALTDKLSGTGERLFKIAERTIETASNIRGAESWLGTVLHKPQAAAVTKPIVKAATIAQPSQKQVEPKQVAEHDTNQKMPIGETAVLRAAIQFVATGLTKKQLAVLTGYKRPTRDAYCARLRTKGFITEANGKIFATHIGIAVLPDAEPLPTGEALRSYWLNKLPSGERVILVMLIDAYPRQIAKTTIDEATNFQRSTRDAYLSRLATKLLIHDAGSGLVAASATLFD